MSHHALIYMTNPVHMTRSTHHTPFIADRGKEHLDLVSLLAYVENVSHHPSIYMMNLIDVAPPTVLHSLQIEEKSILI